MILFLIEKNVCLPYLFIILWTKTMMFDRFFVFIWFEWQMNKTEKLKHTKITKMKKKSHEKEPSN